MKVLKSLLLSILFCSPSVAQVIGIQTYTAGGQTLADNTSECGRLVTVNAELPAGSTIWFVQTPNVDYQVFDNKLLIATPCRNESIVIFVQGIDWEARTVGGQRVVTIDVRCSTPDPPVPNPTEIGLNIPEPSNALKEKVQPIKQSLTAVEKELKAKVSWVFAGIGLMLSNPSGSLVKDTDIFGQINREAFRSLEIANTGLSIGSELKQILEEHAGVTETRKNLSDQDRRKIAEVLFAVSWAANS